MLSEPCHEQPLAAPVADAYADNVPLLVIAGQVPECKLGTDSFQHIDVSRVFGATAKRADMIIQENDFFFAIGVRWDDRVAEKVGFAIRSRIATIDIDPAKVHQIRSERNPDFSVIGDAPTFVPASSSSLPRTAPR